MPSSRQEQQELTEALGTLRAVIAEAKTELDAARDDVTAIRTALGIPPTRTSLTLVRDADDA